MNTTIISGRLVRNPGYNEVENEKGLHKIAKFVLAVRRNYSDEVSFIPVKAFAKKAEFARDYLMQGTKVMVEGEIVTGNYEDKDTGKKIYTTEVYANRIEFAGAKMVDRPPFPEEFHWHDEYATLNFFRFICKNIGNLRNGEIEKMVTRLKNIDQKAVENHVNGAVWAFDYDKMFCVLMENAICRKVCEKNKYNSWMNLIGQYCVSRT